MAAKIMSMTGFAAVQGSHDNWIWSGDIRGVNGKSLDLRLRLPDIEGLEPEVKKRCQARIGRGNVTVQLKLARDEAAGDVSLNEDGLANALSLLARIGHAANAAGVVLRDISAAEIAGMRGVLETAEVTAEDTEALKTGLIESLDAGLDAFVADRAREGRALALVISRQIEQIEALTRAAAEALGDREAAQRANMQRALSRLLETGDMPDETRLAQELALIAVKTDVSEELDRLAAHVDAARKLLETEGPVGRKLDFLMQEFNREANTLCSKAQSAALTTIGLDLKTVIDQMREQIQNIE